MLAATSRAKVATPWEGNGNNKVVKQIGKVNGGKAAKGDRGGKAGKGAKDGKGKGKGGKVGKLGLTKTPDGRLVCGFHNTAAGCTKGDSCQFCYICNICFAADHIGSHCTVTARVL